MLWIIGIYDNAMPVVMCSDRTSAWGACNLDTIPWGQSQVARVHAQVWLCHCWKMEGNGLHGSCYSSAQSFSKKNGNSTRTEYTVSSTNEWITLMSFIHFISKRTTVIYVPKLGQLVGVGVYAGVGVVVGVGVTITVTVLVIVTISDNVVSAHKTTKRWCILCQFTLQK